MQYFDPNKYIQILRYLVNNILYLFDKQWGSFFRRLEVTSF